MTQPLPEWPEPWSLYETCDVIEYERARADAAMARLRVAVAELSRHTGHHECEDCWYSCATLCCDERRKSDECDCGAHRVADVLALIGELPPPPSGA